MVAFPVWINVSVLQDDHVLAWSHEDHGRTLWVVLWDPYCHGDFVVVVAVADRQESIQAQQQLRPAVFMHCHDSQSRGLCQESWLEIPKMLVRGRIKGFDWSVAATSAYTRGGSRYSCRHIQRDVQEGGGPYVGDVGLQPCEHVP